MVKRIKWRQGNYRKLSEHDSSKEDWQSYIERLELYFTGNDTDDEEKRKAILLTSRGIECYRLFKELTTPRKPVDKTFIDLVTLMANHESPKRNPIVERFFFNMRNRKLGESISQYMAELRRLSQYCEHGDSLESMLRDRLVCGVNHDRTQQTTSTKRRYKSHTAKSYGYFLIARISY